MSTKGKMISRSLTRSQKMSRLPDDTHRLFFVLLLLDLDNIGRGIGDPFYLKGKVYDRRPEITPEIIEKMLVALHDVGLIIWYEVEGSRYIQDPVHDAHNKCVGNMKKSSDYPQPGDKDVSDWEIKNNKVYTPFEQSTNGVSTEEEEEEEDKEEEESKALTKRERFVRPKIQEVFDYFIQKAPAGMSKDAVAHEADKFFNYYESNGWRVGRNPMKNWQAAVRNWVKNIKTWRSAPGGINRIKETARSIAEELEGLT